MSRKLLLSAEGSSPRDKDEKKEKNAAHECAFAKNRRSGLYCEEERNGRVKSFL
jgi:hypothetical protein